MIIPPLLLYGLLPVWEKTKHIPALEFIVPIVPSIFVLFFFTPTVSSTFLISFSPGRLRSCYIFVSAFLASFFYRLYSPPLAIQFAWNPCFFLSKRCLSVAFQRTAVILVPSPFIPYIPLLSSVCYWQQMIWYGAIYIYVHLVSYVLDHAR